MKRTWKVVHKCEQNKVNKKSGRKNKVNKKKKWEKKNYARKKRCMPTVENEVSKL